MPEEDVSSEVHNPQGEDYDTMPRYIFQHLTIHLPDGKPGELILILPYSESSWALKVVQLLSCNWGFISLLEKQQIPSPPRQYSHFSFILLVKCMRLIGFCHFRDMKRYVLGVNGRICKDWGHKIWGYFCLLFNFYLTEETSRNFYTETKVSDIFC